MKNKGIFTRQNQTLINLFRDAEHPDKVLFIPIDYAKTTHVALCCNGSGKVLRTAFLIKNMPSCSRCRKQHIKREHVFFGGIALPDKQPLLARPDRCAAGQGLVTVTQDPRAARLRRKTADFTDMRG